MKEQPFYFGTVVSRRVFLNREQELHRMLKNLENGVNTVLISPRRWGKTSLVQRLSETTKDANLVFVFLDLFRVSGKKQFFEHFAKQVLDASESGMEELMRDIKKFFSKLIPEISFTADPQTEFGFKLNWKEEELPEEEILDLPEKLAKEKGKRFVLCIDEFQDLAGFDKDEKLQKRLRSHWQHHQNVTYILYGSKRSLMNEFFTKPNMPFYGFGDILFLERISEEHWQSYIQKRFELFGKDVSSVAALAIARLMNCHSYYVQQLAYVTFLNTEDKADLKEVDFALEMMLHQNQILYRKIMDDLSASQIEYLRALTEGVTSFYSKKNMKKYDLGSVGNIKRIKEALENKEVLDYFEGEPQFLDPAFALWFRKWYLGQSLEQIHGV